MTETNTGRDRLERLQSMECADYLHMALLDRAEKAEASLSQMRDAVAEIEGVSEDWPTHGNIPLAIVAGYSLHKSGREEAEAERNTAWNDAIEAAAECADGSSFLTMGIRDAILALKKGDAPEVTVQEAAKVQALFRDAVSEAKKAMHKFPQPNYIISKVAEEAGEVVSDEELAAFDAGWKAGYDEALAVHGVPTNPGPEPEIIRE